MAAAVEPRIDVGQLIDARPLSGIALRVLILCALVMLLDGYDLQTMALAVPSIAAHWELPPAGFWLAQSAGVLGMGLGSALLAPLGDRIGRRPIIIGFVLLVGCASLCTPLAVSIVQFAAWRLLTGLGLGASLANATALTSEYVPARRHTLLVTLMFSNVAVGAFVAAYTAPAIIARFGWRGLFVCGGLLPLALGLCLLVALPESLRFLLASRSGDRAIGPLLARIAPGHSRAMVYVPQAGPLRRGSVRELLTPEYRRRTLLLWGMFCLNLAVVYFLISWLPALLGAESWSRDAALRGTALFQAGGVAGGVLVAWRLDRGRMAQTLASAYLVAAAVLAVFLLTHPTVGLWSALILVLGIGVSGAQLALYALAAQAYPPAIRATGLGWTATVSRLGAVCGPIIGGWLLRLEMGAGGILGVLLLPTLACALGATLLPRALRRTSSRA